jgi:hypothetical protein
MVPVTVRDELCRVVVELKSAFIEGGRWRGE